MEVDYIRPVWAEINLDNLAYNMRKVRERVGKEALVMAVVKANAYGHGSIKAAETFLNNGADRLAVAILREALELRRANINAPILVLGYTPKCQYHNVVKYDIIQTIWDYESAKILSDTAVQLNKKAIIHIKIDSGMGRIGFSSKEKAIEEITNISNLPNLYIEGIYTHFATADEKDKSYSRKQYEYFMEIIEALEQRNISIPIKHVSNSAAIIDLPEYNLNMVRPGIMLYGLYPSDEVEKERVDLRPAMALKAMISHIKEVPNGTGISYGRIFITKRQSKIATLPIGYADGFPRLLTSKGEAFLKGKRVPVVGKICMDQCMIDITDLDDVKIGDEVTLFGYEEGVPHVDEIADKLSTINYEIVSTVGRRVPRIYVKNGEIIDIEDYLLGEA